jgi:hypothetical protein
VNGVISGTKRPPSGCDAVVMPTMLPRPDGPGPVHVYGSLVKLT